MGLRTKEKLLSQNFYNFPMIPSKRVSFLIDSEQYFQTLTLALLKAKECIYISAWEISGKMKLDQTELGQLYLKDFLKSLCQKNHQLKVYILCWDYIWPYNQGRDPSFKEEREELAKERIFFYLDPHHPFTACHHEKYVIIDEQLCFTGGIDLCDARWDTPAHKIDDINRKDQTGKIYTPIHDLQVLLEGEICKVLVRDFKQRWNKLSKRSLHLPLIKDNPKFPNSKSIYNLWPETLDAHLENPLYTGIAKTRPPYRGENMTTEILDSYLSGIEKAKRLIYIENQYFTSQEIALALSKKLQDSQGPEIILVLTKYWTAFIEYATMGGLQSKLIEDLRSGDKWDHLRVVTPFILEGGKKEYIKVHSKFLLCDDQFLFLGSANLNNRSMGMDTECNFALETRDDFKVCSTLQQLLHSLLSEHLGTVLDKNILTSKIIPIIDNQINPERSLEKWENEDLNKYPALSFFARLVDPRKPFGSLTAPLIIIFPWILLFFFLVNLQSCNL